MSRHDNSAQARQFGKLRAYMMGLAFSLLTSVVTLSIAAAMITVMELNLSVAGAAVLVSAALGAFVAGFYIAFKTGSMGLITGVCGGALYFFAIYTVGVLSSQQLPLDMSVFIRLAVCLIMGAAGGVVGVNLGLARRY